MISEKAIDNLHTKVVQCNTVEELGLRVDL